MTRKHIVKSYDDELKELKEKIVAMGTAAHGQLEKAETALSEADTAMAKKVMSEDRSINQIQAQVDEMVVYMLARRQPMAGDLRVIVSSLKIGAEIERVADYAASIARHAIQFKRSDLKEPLSLIQQMSHIGREMLLLVMDAFQNLDDEKALSAWRQDDELDERYAKLLSGLRALMTENTDNIKDCTGLLFVGRCCERIGDHITNIAENIHYIVTGKPFPMVEMKH